MTEYTFKKIGGKIDDRIVANPKDVEVAAYHQHNRNPSADDKTNYYNGEKELMEKRREEIEGLSFPKDTLTAPGKRAPKVSFAKKTKETKATKEAPAEEMPGKELPTQKALAGKALADKTIEGPSGSYAKGPALGVRGTSKPYDGLKVASDTPKKKETPKGKVKTLVKENKRKNLRGCLTFLAATALIAAAVYGAHRLGARNGKAAGDAQLKDGYATEQVQGADTTEVTEAKDGAKADVAGPSGSHTTVYNVHNNINNKTYNNSNVTYVNVNMPEGSDVSKTDGEASEEIERQRYRERISPDGSYRRSWQEIDKNGKKTNISETGYIDANGNRVPLNQQTRPAVQHNIPSRGGRG